MNGIKRVASLCGGCLFLLFCAACSSGKQLSQTQVQVEQLERERWAEIEQYIDRNWMKYIDTDSLLPKPYSYALNPGTLYYWDLYFINEGLMIHDYWGQAQNNIDCFIFEIEKLGFIPNANRWGEDRSMTPYFAMMVKSYYEKAPAKDSAWLMRAYRAVLKEYEFWTNGNGNRIEDHTTEIPGLQRYGHHADTAALVEFYDKVLQGRFQLQKEVPLEIKIRMGGDRLAEAECMDFTPRFDGRITDFIPVDLNANLCQYEKILAWMERTLSVSNGKIWEKKAKKRAKLIRRYLWNEERGLFLDYDYVQQKHTTVASIITLMPLYWGFATRREAGRIVSNLHLFDSNGGLVVCEKSEHPDFYQWGHTSVWAPMQFIAIGALDNYNYRSQAYLYALKWLRTVTSNYTAPYPKTHRPFKYGDGNRSPGFLYEKYSREGYINDREYPCSVMMGWTAATFLRAKRYVEFSAPIF